MCLTSELAVLKSLKRKKYGKASLKRKEQILFQLTGLLLKEQCRWGGADMYALNCFFRALVSNGIYLINGTVFKTPLNQWGTD